MSIVFSSVSVTLGDTQALSDVSLALEEKRVAIIGSNGSGKSTLARAACAAVPLQSGSIRAYGEDVFAHGALWRDVTMTFQIPDRQILMPSVREELLFGLINCGVEKNAAEEKAREAARTLGVALEHPCHSLSEGKKRMLCLLSIVLMEPRTVILDEPTTFLDYPTQRDFMDYVAALPQQVIFITQNLDEAQKFDRAVCLDRGRVAFDGGGKEAVRRYKALWNAKNKPAASANKQTKGPRRG